MNYGGSLATSPRVIERGPIWSVFGYSKPRNFTVDSYSIRSILVLYLSKTVTSILIEFGYFHIIQTGSGSFINATDMCRVGFIASILNCFWWYIFYMLSLELWSDTNAAHKLSFFSTRALPMLFAYVSFMLVSCHGFPCRCSSEYVRVPLAMYMSEQNMKHSKKWWCSIRSKWHQNEY